MEDNHITDERARRFVAGLRRFEQDCDAAALTELFAPDAITQRFDARGERQGEVEQFWKEYRAQFQEVRTTFYNAIEGGDEFALEWSSHAVLTDGRPLEYRGVTAIGCDGDTIVWLRTYYDSAQFAMTPADTG
jgi:ketosteroid isomerase-like protein